MKNYTCPECHGAKISLITGVQCTECHDLGYVSQRAFWSYTCAAPPTPKMLAEIEALSDQTDPAWPIVNLI